MIPDLRHHDDPADRCEPPLDAIPAPAERLDGWAAIAAAVGRALASSCSIRTAQRYAKPGRRNRLPVWQFDNGRVFLRRSALDPWVTAERGAR